MLEAAKHILFITGEYPPQTGGVGAYTEKLATALAESGYKSSVLTTSAVRDHDFDGVVDVHASVSRWNRRACAQAAQLATHLQKQQASIDHRESELNARNAAIENQVRGARLWLSERHTELSQRQAELDRREKELAQREAELVLNARQVRKPLTGEKPNPTNSAELDARSAELDRRQAELEALASRLSEQVSVAARAQEEGSDDVVRDAAG